MADTTGNDSVQPPSPELIAARVAEGRRLLREHFGMTLTDAELDEGPDLLQRVYDIAGVPRPNSGG